MDDIDANIYILLNDDLKHTKYNNPDTARFHYKAYGCNEGRPTTIKDLYNDFRPSMYNMLNADLQKYKLKPNKLIEHWLGKGRFEHRNYRPELNSDKIYLYTDDLNYTRAEDFSTILKHLGLEFEITMDGILNTNHLYILFTHRQITYFPFYYVLYLENYDIPEIILESSTILLLDNLDIPDNIKKYIYKIFLAKSESPEKTLVIERSILYKRFLIACEYPKLDYKLSLDNKNIYCLTQIEYNFRLNKFRNQKYLPSNIDYINGLKHPIGWIGCGMSYKFLMKNASLLDLPYITICQDDVVFNEYFNKNYGKIVTYLENNDIWDIFVGINMVTDSNIRVLNKFKTRDGIELLQIDKFSSLAFVIFNKSIYKLVENWGTTHRVFPKDTLINYLCEKKMRIFTINPFLVGYNLDVSSTISKLKKNENVFSRIRICENNIQSKKILLK